MLVHDVNILLHLHSNPKNDLRVKAARSVCCHHYSSNATQTILSPSALRFRK